MDFDGPQDAYTADAPFLRGLGLATTGFGRQWTDLGTVTVEEESDGRSAATVKVEVCALPAQFFRFTVTRPRDSVDPEPVEVFELTTGSGNFREYWPAAEQMARNLLGVKRLS